MKNWQKVLACLGLLVVCTGCDAELLLTNPDDVQALITDRLDLVLSAVGDWIVYGAEVTARLPFGG